MCSSNQHPARARGVLSSPALILAIASLLTVGSCTSTSQKSSELQPQPISASPSPGSAPLAVLGTPTPSPGAQMAPPKKDEVAGAIARVFVKTVSFDESSGTAFVAGD